MYAVGTTSFLFAAISCMNLNLDTNSYLKIVTNCLALREINFSGQAIRDEGNGDHLRFLMRPVLIAIGENLKDLFHFRCKFATLCTTPALSSLLTGCPKLTFLDVQGAPGS